MSVTTTTTEVEYTGTGAAPMPVPFPFFEEGDLEVTANGVAVGFSVTGNPRTASASVVLDAVLGSSQTILIRRAMDMLQPTTFGLQGVFSPKAHEAAFDRAVMLVQDEYRKRVEAVAAEAADRIAAVFAEAAARQAGDQAIIQAGIEVGLSDASYVTGDGLYAARQLREWMGDALNVKGFGAIGLYNDGPAWSSGTTYGGSGAGTHDVIVTTGGRSYMSIQGGNLNHDPASSPAWWKDLGVTHTEDDTLAFQRAIDASPWRPIYVPDGNYKITSKLSLVGRVRFSMIGNGRRYNDSASTLWVSGISGYLFDMDDAGSLVGDFSMVGICVDGNVTRGPVASSSTWLGFLKNTQGNTGSNAQIYLHWCNIKNASSASAIMFNTPQTWGMQMNECNFENFWNGMFMATFAPSTMRFTRCYIHYMAQIFRVSAGMITFRDCIFESVRTVGWFSRCSIILDTVHHENIGYIDAGDPIDGQDQHPDTWLPTGALIDTYYNLHWCRLEFVNPMFSITHETTTAMFRLFTNRAAAWYFKSGGLIFRGPLTLGGGGSAAMSKKFLVTDYDDWEPGDWPISPWDIQLLDGDSIGTVEYQFGVEGQTFSENLLRKVTRGNINVLIGGEKYRRLEINQGQFTFYENVKEPVGSQPFVNASAIVGQNAIPYRAGDRCVNPVPWTAGDPCEWECIRAASTTAPSGFDWSAGSDVVPKTVTITVADAAGMEVGDNIYILPGTAARWNQLWTSVITNIAGNVVSFEIVSGLVIAEPVSVWTAKWNVSKTYLSSSSAAATPDHGAVAFGEADTIKDITFATPRSSNQYFIVATLGGWNGTPALGAWVFEAENPTVNGFRLKCRDAPGAGADTSVNWFLIPLP